MFIDWTEPHGVFASVLYMGGTYLEMLLSILLNAIAITVSLCYLYLYSRLRHTPENSTGYGL